MTKTTKAKFGPQEFDVRVRERYLANGTLDAKMIEKHLGELKDVAANAETVDLQQPAIVGNDDDEDDLDDEPVVES
jgi:hypothetical protein